MNLVERAKNILVSPAKEWEVIKTEQTTVNQLIMSYVLLLAAIPAVAGFIGYTVFGVSWGLGSFQLPFDLGIKWAIVTYVLSIVGVFIIAYIMDMLAPSFGSTKDLVTSMKVVVYSFTASWIGGIFQIFPALSIIAALAGIYSLVLLYQGIKIVKQVPQDKLVGYFVTVIIAFIVVYFITGWIVSSLTFGSNLNSIMNPY